MKRFLSIMRPVLPVEVGGRYFIKLPLISMGLILTVFSRDWCDLPPAGVVGLESGDMEPVELGELASVMVLAGER